MSFCTLGKLAADQSLGLRLLVETCQLDEALRGVHGSDLEHPAQYVLPGELLLTNGLWLGHADPREWVQEARAAGAVAIGYGVSNFTRSSQTSSSTHAASWRWRLSRFPRTCRSTIGERILEHNHTQVAAVRLQLTRLRKLLQDLARGEGHGAVLELLRRETRLDAWLVGVGSHRMLLDFVDPDVLHAYHQSVLGPIERWDEEHNSQLLETLAAFFDNNGHWRKTAAQLHIHHNTLHYRLDKIAGLTGRSVDSAEGRVDFALALAIPRG